MRLELQGNVALQLTEPGYRTIQPNLNKISEINNQDDKESSKKMSGIVPKKVMQKAEKEINHALFGSNTRVEFSVFKPTREIMIKIKDNETGKVIKEIPSKKELEMAAYMKKLAGIIVDEKV